MDSHPFTREQMALTQLEMDGRLGKQGGEDTRYLPSLSGIWKCSSGEHMEQLYKTLVTPQLE